MKTEKEIKQEIKRVTLAYRHVLDCGLATVEVNAPRALMQQDAQIQLNTLYATIGKKRPRFRCDDKSKINT